LRMLTSNESITVKTEIMAKIPMVIPSKDKKVRSLLTTSELKAKKTLSFSKWRNTIINDISYRIVLSKVNGIK